MDETLQPDFSPSQWEKSAPIQELLARGDAVKDASPSPAAEHPTEDAPATTAVVEDTGFGGLVNTMKGLLLSSIQTIKCSITTGMP